MDNPLERWKPLVDISRNWPHEELPSPKERALIELYDYAERLQGEFAAAKQRVWWPVSDGEHEADGPGEAYFVDGAQLTVIEPKLYAEGNHTATIDLTGDVRLCRCAPSEPEQPITQEALKAAGWEITDYTSYASAALVFEGIRIDIALNEHGSQAYVLLGNEVQICHGVRTLSDLSTLVSLLTGAPLPGEGEHG